MPSHRSQFPHFNASLDDRHRELRGQALLPHRARRLDADDGLVVPVLRDADEKGVIEIAGGNRRSTREGQKQEIALDASAGRDVHDLEPGRHRWHGLHATSYVNAPEVANTSCCMPMEGDAGFRRRRAFRPRTMLPLSLSYDHRAIDGAEAARFITHLSSVLSDARRLIL
ncbi:MAG: 2-oxo acid dehydrogenase subunit E2 [Gammaproteobacteria bacterium]|nr:2-oxo acid dehydrogenase subunit E2 [Gammaproteobacteria bacterium]